MRSKLFAMTALTPSSCVPLAAQSRDDPVPYSSPAKITVGVPRFDVRHRRVVDRQLRTLSGCIVRHAAFDRGEPSALGGSIRFLMRTLANVPRIITSWLPRRLNRSC